MADRHTLVIPTYNRPALLRQLVSYVAARGGPLKILVLDSSAPATAAENAKGLQAHGDLVRHVVFPEDMPPVDKLVQGLNLVTTPFVSCCADDDVVFPAALHEAIAFLDGKPDYVGAHGLYLNFRREGRTLHLTREYAGPGNDAGHPGARVFRLLQRYESLYYAVFRTAELREVMAPLPSVRALVYQELFQSVAALIKGKVRRLPLVYAARQSVAAAEPGRERWQTFDWFAKNPVEVLEHYRAYREQVWTFYERHGAQPRLEREHFLRSLDLGHAVYFTTGCRPEHFHSTLQAYWPEDAYLDAANVDLFARGLESQVQGGFDRSRLPRLAGYAVGAVCAVPYLYWLNVQIARACREPWKCLPARNQRWLALNPQFRSGCVELCRYMDHA